MASRLLARPSACSLGQLRWAAPQSVAVPTAPTARAFHATRPSQSYVGKRLITLPKEVTVKVEDLDIAPATNSRRHVVVTGPKGTLKMPIFPFISFDETPVQESDMRRLKVMCEDPKEKKQRQMWGTTNALVTNMVEGVSDGVSLIVRLVGVGYRATLVDNKLDLKLGYSHQILVPVPDGVTVAVQNPQRIKLSGIDWPLVTKFASQIRAWRPPEPYNQKGVFVGDETIQKKEGKKK
ncbi:ribosomal protein L6, alpha-beta domain-containing protein [Hyaloraphidium curvatum]|nr:ribosomal protein L6, alpha-beta domain-containing protein [Hyaloraphidium curvatum]